MLIVESKQADNYTILDTDDMVSEVVSKEDLLNALEQGIFIYGVSEFSLRNNIDITLILRLYGDDDIKDFDGFLLRDYSDDYSEFTTQIIDFRDNSDTLVLDQVFYKIIDIIKSNNNFSTNINTNLPVGYKVFAYGDELLTIKDLSDGNSYICDFYSCLYIYSDEKMSIDGIDEICCDYMICNGNYYSADSVLLKYKKSSISSKIKKSIKSFDADIDDFYSTWNNINSDFGNNDCIKVTDCRFPLYNIKRCINKIDDNLSDKYFEALTSVACDFSSGKLSFKNGKSIQGAENISKYFKAIKFETLELKDDVFRFIETSKTKEMVFKKDLGICSNLNLSATHNDNMCIIKCPPYRINDFRHQDICILRTKFGLIYNMQSSFMDLDMSFANMFLVRLTNCGSCWLSTEKGKIIVGTAKSSWSDGNLCNDQFLNACWSGITHGISYHGDVIIPLGLSSIHIDERAIDIKIYCMILGNVDCTQAHSINVVEVPLLFLGSKLDEFNNGYRFQGLFSTLYLEKSVIQSLEGYFDEDSFMNAWDSLSTKQSKELYKCLYKNSKSVLRQVSNL